MDRTPARRLASRIAWGSLVGALALSAHACTHDWDKYDPLLGASTGASSASAASSSASGGGKGGSGGASSSSGGDGGTCAKTDPIEDCATLADDDCDGKANDHCGLWAEPFTGNSVQAGYAVAVTPDAGTLAFTGFDWGNTHFAGHQINTAHAGQTFVVAFTPSAVGLTFKWGQEFGYGTSTSLAFDPMENLLVAGTFATMLQPCPGQPAFPDPLTSANAHKMFVVKYDTTGACRFATSFGNGTYDTLGTSVVGDSSGVYLGGSFGTKVDFGDGPVTASNEGGVVVKLADDGMGHATLLWKAIIDGTFNDQVTALALTPEGNVVLGGSYTQSLTFGGNKLLAVNSQGGSTSAIVAKLVGSSGAPVWSRGFTNATASTAGTTTVSSVGVEPATGDVLVAGTFSGVTDFSGTAAEADAGAPDAACVLTSSGFVSDLFVLRLAAGDGHCLWATRIGATAAVVPTPRLLVHGPGCATAGAACVTVGFTLTATLTLGNWSLEPVDDDVLLFTLDSQGKPVWARLFGGLDTQDLGGIAADASGAVYATGSYAGSITFAPTLTLGPASSQPDAFLARIAAP